MSKKGKTEFEVSFDGSFSRRLKDTEFFVSLPILHRSGSSELKDYLPKRGEDSSEDSSRSEEKEPAARRGTKQRERLKDLVSSESEDEKDSTSEASPPPPSALRRIAWAWERRALQAEEDLKRFKQGLMVRSGGVKLMDSLEFLLNSDEGEGAQFDDGGVSTWNANAFNTMPKEKWLVLKVPQANRSHVMCDFCDGDDLDGKE
jgi:hypothetical protein